MDNVRIIPRQGIYTSADSDDVGNVEWGTISAGVTLSPGATAGPYGGTEDLFLTTGFSGEDFSARDPGYDPTIDPAVNTVLARGGAISATGSRVRYRAYLMTKSANLDQSVVLDDVIITYLPATKILSQRKN